MLGTFSRDFFPADIFSRGPFFQRTFFSGTFFPGTIFPGSFFSGDHFSEDFLSGDFFKGHFFPGDLLPGTIFPVTSGDFFFTGRFSMTFCRGIFFRVPSSIEGDFYIKIENSPARYFSNMLLGVLLMLVGYLRLHEVVISFY